MVVGVGCPLLILQENTGYATHSKGIVIAVGRQFATVNVFEKTHFAVYILKLAETRHTCFAELSIKGWIVIANHIDIEQVTYLR